jgi:hypothetical protein
MEPHIVGGIMLAKVDEAAAQLVELWTLNRLITPCKGHGSTIAWQGLCDVRGIYLSAARLTLSCRNHT